MARYADNLLADGERAVLRTRQHFLATIFDGRTAWATFIASVVLFFLSGSVTQEIPQRVFQWIALGLLVISLFWLLKVYASWYAEDYMVTNRRVLKVEGIFRKRSADSSLEEEFLRVPAPPLRAAPMMAAGPGMSSTEITKALGELADLRDRGAISPEDYEAKKSDLLGRI